MISDKDFQKEVAEAMKMFTALEIAEYVDVSVPTVRRWADGRNSPHPTMRQLVVDDLQRMRKGLCKL